MHTRQFSRIGWMGITTMENRSRRFLRYFRICIQELVALSSCGIMGEFRGKNKVSKA
jgi:hypothetical protein